MTWYLRKALSLGPFRFNLSKGGIGTSVGFSGLRIGNGPHGSYVHMGRGGLYARVPLNGATRSQSTDTVDGGFRDFYESQAAESFRPASREEFLGHVTSSVLAFRMAAHILLSGVVLTAASWWIMGRTAALFTIVATTGIAAVLLFQSFFRRVHVRLSLDEGATTLLDSIAGTLDVASRESSLWHVDEAKTIQSVGFPDGITMAKKDRAPVGIGSPYGLVIEPPVPWVGVGRQRLYFMPDQLLITDYWGVGAVPYNDLYIQTSPLTLADRGQRPPTVQYAGTTWPHTRIDGERDRRYSDNPAVPLGAYWQLTLESSSGLREALLFADRGKADALSRVLRTLAEIDTTFTRLSPEVAHSDTSPSN